MKHVCWGLASDHRGTSLSLFGLLGKSILIHKIWSHMHSNENGMNPIKLSGIERGTGFRFRSSYGSPLGFSQLFSSVLIRSYDSIAVLFSRRKRNLRLAVRHMITTKFRSRWIVDWMSLAILPCIADRAQRRPIVLDAILFQCVPEKSESDFLPTIGQQDESKSIGS